MEKAEVPVRGLAEALVAAEGDPVRRVEVKGVGISQDLVLVGTAFAPSVDIKSLMWLVSAAWIGFALSAGRAWCASEPMKIVMTTSAPEFEAGLDHRFGRGAYLLFVDTETHEWEACSNPGVEAPGGAGIKATQMITNLKVDAVISGDFGPHAFEALKASGVAMYLYGDCRSPQEVLERFKAGQLEQVGVPTRGDCHSSNRGSR